MTAALIIAAGKAREQRQFDPGKKVGDTNAIKRCILTFQQAGVERVVVCGADEDRVEKLAPHMNVSFLRSSKDGEMLDSIKVGLRFLQGKCGAVLIVHTDIPLFSVETVRQLLNANGDLCIPVYQGRPGHPIRMAAGLIPQILSYQATMGWPAPSGCRGAPHAPGSGGRRGPSPRPGSRRLPAGAFPLARNPPACLSLSAIGQNPFLWPRRPSIAAIDPRAGLPVRCLPLHGDLLYQGPQDHRQHRAKHWLSRFGAHPGGQNRGRFLRDPYGPSADWQL